LGIIVGLSTSVLDGGRVSAADATKPEADQILRQMSDTLASARQISFKARRSLDAGLAPSGVVTEARIEATVQRPNLVTAHAAGINDSRRFVFDGRTLTLHDETKNLYASVPMRTSIDGLVDKVDEVYGFSLPLAEFFVSNPYSDLRRQAKTVSYIGIATHHDGLFAPRIKCHRIALGGKLADAELWVGVADHLPYRLVATFKNHPDKPQLKAEFSSWDLAAKTSPSDFAFTPPKDAMKIEMRKREK
jgi:hypothetical protein